MNTSEFNKYNPDSIYAINYDNSDNTNKLNIYVINDENIIEELDYICSMILKHEFNIKINNDYLDLL